MLTNPLPLQSMLCFKIYSASILITRLYQPLLKPYNITYLQFLVLVLLNTTNNLKVKEICSYLQIDTGTISPVLKNLEKKDFIAKVRPPYDERIVIISLTKKGANFKNTITAIQNQIGSAFGNCNTDLQALEAGLEQIINTLQKVT